MDEGDKWFYGGILVFLVVVIAGIYLYQTGANPAQTIMSSSQRFLGADSLQLAGDRYVAPEDQFSIIGGSSGPSTTTNTYYDVNGDLLPAGKVYATATDSNADYLLSKLVAGNNIAFNLNNPGANETITISTDAPYLTTEVDPHYSADSPNIVYDGNDVSRLVNDVNYQSYGDVLALGFLASELDPIFSGVSSDIVFDGNDVSRLVNDVNYQDYNDVGAFLTPYAKWTDANSFFAFKTDVNSWGDALYLSIDDANTNYQLKGDYLVADPDIVYDGNNVSRLVNDSGYLTKGNGDGNYLSIPDANASYLLISTAGLTYLSIPDANASYLMKLLASQTYATIADSNGQFQKKGQYIAFNDGNLADFIKVNDGNYAKNTDLNNYLYTSTAASTYTTIADSNTEYAKKNQQYILWNDGNLANFLKLNDGNYAKNTDLNNYLYTSTAASTYCTITDANKYLPLAGGVMTGDINMAYTNAIDANSFIVLGGTHRSFIDDNGTCMRIRSGATTVYIGC